SRRGATGGALYDAGGGGRRAVSDGVAFDARLPSSAGRPGDRTLSCAQRCGSEEHTSELQSLTNLVYRLLLEKTAGLAASAVQPDKGFQEIGIGGGALDVFPNSGALFFKNQRRPRNCPLCPSGGFAE